MRKGIRLARKELRDTMRERTIIVALLVQFFVAAFSAFLTVGLLGLYDPDAIDRFPDADVAYVGPGGFDTYLRRAPNLDLQVLSYEQARQAFSDGRVLAIIEETIPNATSARTVTILLPEGELQTTLLVTQVKGLLRDYEDDLRADRQGRIQSPLLDASTDARPNSYFGFAFGLLLPLLVATPVFLAGATSGDSMAQEINTKTLHILASAPLGALDILIGKITTPVLLAGAQVALWVLLLRANGLEIQGLATLILLALLHSVLLASLSVLIAVAVRRQGPTQAAYSLLILLAATGSLFLPQDPLNLIARIAVGRTNLDTLLTLLSYAVLAAAASAAAWLALNQRLKVQGP
jgi:ABC-2 type transport system permease protein